MSKNPDLEKVVAAWDDITTFKKDMNPFNAETAITFRVNVSGHVDLAVFDLAGQRIRTLFSGRRETGAHVVRWNGRDDGGTEVASGVYLYRLETREFKEARRLTLLK